MRTYEFDHYSFLQNGYDGILKGLKLLTNHVNLKKSGAFVFSMSQQLTIQGITVTLHKYNIQYLTLMSGTLHT
jgi:hypothetical protein